MNTERAIKKYLRAVRRRLNLPRELKERRISDLSTTISARLEQGQSWETIRGSLGTPKALAAESMEQMGEFACRKSPWRFLFLAAAVYGGLELLGNLCAGVLYLLLCAPSRSASLGIIGGADGPTAVFVTTPGWTRMLLPVLLIVVGILGYLRLRKCNK